MLKKRFMSWESLLLHDLKRDWIKILIWVIGLGAFSAGFVPAFVEITKGQGLIGMYEVLQNPAMMSIVGPTPIDVATYYTIGAFYSHTMLLFSSLIAMIMSALHIVGRTRKEEDSGLLELVRSFEIGRQANSLAAIKEMVVINILLAIFTSGLLYSFDADTITMEGSLLFGISIGMAGIIGGALALVLSQIMSSSSSAIGSSLGIIGLLYIIRAGTDISNVDLSMINPLGWTYLTYPFTENNWIPLLYAAIFSIVLVIIAFALEGGRDMGAGYLPERQGRANAKKSLLSVSGLFIRINRGTIIAWLIGYSILGISYGAVYGDMEAFIKNSELAQLMFTQSGVSLEISFTSTIMMVMMGLVCIIPIVIINKLFAVEINSYITQLQATRVTRGRLYWTNIVLATVVGLTGIIVSAASLGATALYVMSDNTTMEMVDFLTSGFNSLPVVLFYVALAALVLGWVPRLGKLVYVYFTYSFFLSYFSGIIDLPDWVLKTAINSWIPMMPMEDFDLSIFITITAISLIMIIVGYLGYNNRDMVEGA